MADILSNNTQGNMLEVKEFIRTKIKDSKEQLNSELVNNPKFEEVFYKELNYIYYKTGKLDFNVDIAEDKNSLSITSYQPVIDCSRVEFRGKNRSFIRTVIYLKEKNMVCEYNQGVLFDRKLLESNNIRTGLSYESKLETYYAAKYFNEYGIEYSDNSYSDIYHFDSNIDDVDLRERTMSSFHKPIFYEYTLAQIPIHVMKATVRNTYRKNGSLSIIHLNVGTGTTNGYENVSSLLYTCHPACPEMLRGEKMIAKAVNLDDGKLKFEIVDNYSDSFEKAFSKAKEEFKTKIEKSYLKESNKKGYEFLLNNI